MKEPAVNTTLINNSVKLAKIEELCDRILLDSNNSIERLLAHKVLDIIEGEE